MDNQNTAQWHDDRCGKITASMLKACLAVTPPKYKVLRESGTTLASCATEAEAVEKLGAALAKKPGFYMDITPATPLLAFTNYVNELACERMTGEVRMIGEPPAIRWGNDQEPFGLEAYEIRTGRIIERVGFVPAIPSTGLLTFGASPDGLVGDDGGVECKCPLVSANHIDCFVNGIPDEHKPQMEGQLIATGRKWIDFISFDPRFQGEYEHLQLYVERYFSDPDLHDQCLSAIHMMEAAVKTFMDSLPKKGDI